MILWFGVCIVILVLFVVCDLCIVNFYRKHILIILLSAKPAFFLRTVP